ncbi:MAG: class I SAM-dependent methyltransferase [Promethearchaeota archaeon]
MKWSKAEVKDLSPILERIKDDLGDLENKNIVVLCSAQGEIVLWLAERMKGGRIIGLELDEASLKFAKRLAKEKGIKNIKFQKARKTRIPLSDEKFDVLISEFIIFPTIMPTEIGQSEMVRILKPGGSIIITDVILTQPMPKELRKKLRAIGLDYLCEATQEDFKDWMLDAGLTEIKIVDFTPLVKSIWEKRRDQEISPEKNESYLLLLEDPVFKLGKSIFYTYVQARKGE